MSILPYETYLLHLAAYPRYKPNPPVHTAIIYVKDDPQCVFQTTCREDFDDFRAHASKIRANSPNRVITHDMLPAMLDTLVETVRAAQCALATPRLTPRLGHGKRKRTMLNDSVVVIEPCDATLLIK